MLERSQAAYGTPLPTGASRRWSRYVALGDSLSEGLGDPQPGGRTRGWATLLAAHLRTLDPELTFTNLAVRGYLTRHVLRRQLSVALAQEPDLVSVFVGGNDVLLRRTFEPARYAEELAAVVAPLAVPGTTVVLSTLPDLAACSPLLPPLRGLLRARVVAANGVVREVAREHGTVLLDAWADPRTRRHAMWSVDRIHPSALGHRLIAQGVAELLGVPMPDADAELPAASPLDVASRYAREAAWLLRYARRSA
ncbi:MAG TPA: SGNH/GDSL hydrolase family protein [Kineosporiaceae bacterium]|jgi:lysophospholipase L1-like esterase|nr:SGNH/GDSL hydrolase family protein [Kineosporiaceae bacterium]